MLAARATAVWVTLLVGSAALPAQALGPTPLGPDSRGQWPVITLSTAELWTTDAAQPPARLPLDLIPEDARPATVALPDIWAQQRPIQGGTLWYRFPLELPATAPAGGWPKLSVHLRKVCMGYQVWLNGELVADGGGMRQPLPRHCYQPVLALLPPHLLREGLNHLDIRVAGVPLAQLASRQRSPQLSEIQIGPQAAMADIQDRRDFWSSTLAQTVGGSVAVFGILMVALGTLRARERYAVYFGLMSMSWAAVMLLIYKIRLPFETHITEKLICFMATVTLAFAVMFLLRYVDRVPRWVAPALLAQTLLVGLLLLLTGPNAVLTVAQPLYNLYAVEGTTALGVCLWQLRRQQPDHFRVMGVLLCVCIVLVALEIASQNGWAPLQDIPLLILALPLLLIGMGTRLLRVFADALHATEELNQQLEARVAQKSGEIEQNYLHIAQMRAEQAAIQERKRIAADLHDDLGAKLLTIAHISESERVSELARQALDEMRLSVRGLTGTPVLANDAVADWRSETVARLHAAGIEADWPTGQDFGALALPARTNLHATRILREAVSNVIRHSAATRCHIQCASEITGPTTVLEVTIDDNGKGLTRAAAAGQGLGQGLTSMKRRAKQLRGQCLIEYRPGQGTTLRLRLPLPTSAEDLARHQARVAAAESALLAQQNTPTVPAPAAANTPTQAVQE